MVHHPRYDMGKHCLFVGSQVGKDYRICFGQQYLKILIYTEPEVFPCFFDSPTDIYQGNAMSGTKVLQIFEVIRASPCGKPFLWGVVDSFPFQCLSSLRGHRFHLDRSGPNPQGPSNRGWSLFLSTEWAQMSRKKLKISLEILYLVM